MEPANDERAVWAENALIHYMNQTTSADDYETALTDLLADLMHLCDREEVSFYRCFRLAEIHYNEEWQEEENEQAKGCGN